MSRLALYFLGPPRVYLDGTAVRLGLLKVLALLAYLAVTAERHSRDELAELLFSDLDREHSRADIRQTLSLLGRAIGEDRLGADRHSVWLPSGRGLWVDVAEFRRLLVDARAAGVDPRTVGRSLARAVDLFRGEFLSGFYLAHNATFEGWQLEEQESLRLGQVSALQRLVEIHGALGSYDQAIERARRWLALDPLEEAVHRQLMLLHSLAGRQSEALRQYEKCRSVLERELGAEPSEETEHLREHIASGKLMPGNTRGPPAHRGPPLFLFARAAEGGEEDVRRQEARLREAVGAARGKVLGMDSPRRSAGGS